jgi:RimJ/RimL family protein N-acetyltransferase
MFATQRLTIEPLELVHAEQLFAALNDDRVGTFIGGPDVSTLPALRHRIWFVADGPSDPHIRWWNFAVLLHDQVIGRLEATSYTASDDHPSFAEIAYLIGPSWWGHGYATEATSWLIGHLIAQGVSEIWATVVPENAASISVAQRVGLSEVPSTEAVAMSQLLASYDEGDVLFRLIAATQETDG